MADLDSAVVEWVKTFTLEDLHFAQPRTEALAASEGFTPSTDLEPFVKSLALRVVLEGDTYVNELAARLSADVERQLMSATNHEGLDVLNRTVQPHLKAVEAVVSRARILLGPNWKSWMDRLELDVTLQVKTVSRTAIEREVSLGTRAPIAVSMPRPFRKF